MHTTLASPRLPPPAIPRCEGGLQRLRGSKGKSPMPSLPAAPPATSSMRLPGEPAATCSTAAASVPAVPPPAIPRCEGGLQRRPVRSNRGPVRGRSQDPASTSARQLHQEVAGTPLDAMPSLRLRAERADAAEKHATAGQTRDDLLRAGRGQASNVGRTAGHCTASSPKRGNGIAAATNTAPL